MSPSTVHQEWIKYISIVIYIYSDNDNFRIIHIRVNTRIYAIRITIHFFSLITAPLNWNSSVLLCLFTFESQCNLVQNPKFTSIFSQFLIHLSINIHLITPYHHDTS